MVNKFNVLRYRELLKKKEILEEQNKFLFDDPDYLELLSYPATVYRQLYFRCYVRYLLNNIFLILKSKMYQHAIKFEDHELKVDFLTLSTQSTNDEKSIDKIASYLFFYFANVESTVSLILWY